jgi:hypothetical protein
VTEDRTAPEPPQHTAVGTRLNWLRAGVLGANDGIVSVAGTWSASRSLGKLWRMPGFTVIDLDGRSATVRYLDMNGQQWRAPDTV